MIRLLSDASKPKTSRSPAKGKTTTSASLAATAPADHSSFEEFGHSSFEEFRSPRGAERSANVEGSRGGAGSGMLNMTDKLMERSGGAWKAPHVRSPTRASPTDFMKCIDGAVSRAREMSREEVKVEEDQPLPGSHLVLGIVLEVGQGILCSVPRLKRRALVFGELWACILLSSGIGCVLVACMLWI